MSPPFSFRLKSSAFLTPIYAFASLLLIGASLPVEASSHREAPFIASRPQVDGTDFYMFRSYEPGRDDFVTLVADYIPLQDPPGGPNFFQMDPNALYEIHIDNNGDAVDDIKFQFRFYNKRKDTALNIGGVPVAIPLIQSGPISGINPATQNTYEQYTINVIRGNLSGSSQPIKNATNGAVLFNKPIDNIGNKTIKNYPAYARQFLYNVNIPGCTAAQARVFVGQRKDPFVVNIGGVADLINIAAPATELAANAEHAEKDNLAKKNITSLIMEVPTVCLTRSTEPVIGGYTTSSMKSGPFTVPATGSSTGNDTTVTGSYVQVSRLGMPLVNEVVIGIKDKDRFNSSQPINDGQFAKYVTNPTLPTLVQLLFPTVKAPTKFPRTDLVATFLTGLPGLNKPASVRPAEMLRLNTSIAPTAKASQNRLGVIGGDNAGFPNGRRPGDDVVDIELRVAQGLLCHVPTLNTAIGCKPSDAPSGTVHLTDGAYIDSSFIDNAFPYIKDPLPGSPN